MSEKKKLTDGQIAEGREKLAETRDKIAETREKLAETRAENREKISEEIEKLMEERGADAADPEELRETYKKARRRLRSTSHHMAIPWRNISETSEAEAAEEFIPAVDASLKEKTMFVARIGISFLSVGTGAWRVRESLNTVSRALKISCTADIGLQTLEVTCFDETDSYVEAMALPGSGINTDKLYSLEVFVREFSDKVETHSLAQLHAILDEFNKKPGNYKHWDVSAGSAMACAAFTFLLGGGIPEIICAFLGAFVGTYVKHKMGAKKIALIGSIIVSVAMACITYVASIKLAELIFHLPDVHEAGYICAMLFIIPGFPLITGGIDLGKLDMRSGLERLAYAIFMITIATLIGWVTALILRFHPQDFVPLNLNPWLNAVLRLIASFAGVYGFSMLYNSPRRMCATAGLIGMFANTLRLELMDVSKFTDGAVVIPAGVCSFLGASLAGFLAFLAKKKVGYPRISLTVPSIVIQVPGLYMYRAVYNLGVDNIAEGNVWLIKSIIMVMALPLGLVVMQVLTDKEFRHGS